MNTHKVDPSQPIDTTNLEPIHMTYEEIVAMVRKIASGQPYMFPLGTGVDVYFNPNISFIADEIGELGKVKTPHQARELAAALTAWAQRKESDDGVSAAKFLFGIMNARGGEPEPQPEMTGDEMYEAECRRDTGPHMSDLYGKQ